MLRDCVQVATESGWLRGVGSSSPYLAIWARGGAGARATEAALAAGDLQEFPSARACTYVMPREQVELGLRIARLTGGDAPFRTAERYLGVTRDEVDRLCDQVLEALADGALEPREIGKRLGSAVRNLGEEGKKRGQTTTLSLATGELQLRGQIVRVPTDGRLDQERYRYRKLERPWQPDRITPEDAAFRLAELYARWVGAVSEPEFRGFSGLTAALSKPAVSALPPSRDRGTGHPGEGSALVGSLDPYIHLQRNPQELIPEGLREAAREMIGSLGKSSGLEDLPCHPILRDGALVGLWEFDLDERRIAAAGFAGLTADDRRAIERTEVFIREELGDFRRFSLDRPSSRTPRLERLRERSA